jgi:DNA repair photolyase
MLNKFDIPTGVMYAPVIPGINDHEMPRVLQRAADSGAKWAGYNIVVLNGSVTLLFTDWLLKNFPDKADKVMNHIKECHDGQMGSKEIGKRYLGAGKMADVIAQQFQLYCKKYQLSNQEIPLETKHFRRMGDTQVNLFSDLDI